jgi:demethylmenaquinone methyltransferase/2-methoxy-6-polyprenyl-1,4-benzoquinol methylase
MPPAPSHPESAAATPTSGEARARQVRTIFSEIAPRYDLLNHVLSLNVDRAWRRRLVDWLGEDLRDSRSPSAVPFDRSRVRVLDACAGTYDLSLELAGRPWFEGFVVALDFAEPMLVEGKTKLEGAAVRAACADGLRMPFPSGTFDAAMVGFGVRNLSDLDSGLRELLRVLRPGGRLAVLEFTTPPSALLRMLYLFYFHRVLPLVGRAVSGHPWAYTYLPESVREFPGPDAFAAKFETAGFREVRWSYLTAGIAAIHLGRKP